MQKIIKALFQKGALTLNIFNKFFFLMILPLLGHTQSVINPKTSDSSYKDSIIPKKVLIVPFFPKMYMSDMNRELMQGGKSQLWVIVSRFSASMTGAIKQQLTTKVYTPEVLEIKDPSPKKDDDLKLVERSISFNYEPLPVKVLDKKKKKEKNNHTETETQQNSGTEVEKYMKTVITSPKLLPYLKEKYGFDYVIFLNQFELRNDYSNPEATISGPSQRMIKLHYTVFNPLGEAVCSNIARKPLPMSETKAEEIIKKYFAPLAGEIAACLPEGAYKKEKIKK